MKNIINRDLIQRETPKNGPGVMIGRCSLDSQIGILRLLTVLFSSTLTTTKQPVASETSTQKIDKGKTTNLLFKAILELTLHKEGIEKEW